MGLGDRQDVGKEEQGMSELTASSWLAQLGGRHCWGREHGKRYWLHKVTWTCLRGSHSRVLGRHRTQGPGAQKRDLGQSRLKPH